MSRRPRLASQVLTALATTLLVLAPGVIPAHATSASWHLPGGRWPTPACTTVEGPAAVLMSRDGLQTVARGNGGSGHSQALITTTSVPGQLIAADGTGYFSSEDAGCTWRRLAAKSLRNSGARFFQGAYGEAWLTADHATIDRISKFGVETIPSPKPGTGVEAIWAQKARVNTLRVVLADGSVHETTTGGRTWRLVAEPPAGVSGVALADIAPTDANHIFMTASRDREVVHLCSTDGGRSWQTVQLEPLGMNTQVRFSPVDPNVVWLYHFWDPMPDPDGNYMGPTEGRVLVSHDGGRTFQLSVTTVRSGALWLFTRIVPDAFDKNKVWFVSGGSDFYNPESDVDRWDDARRELEHHTLAPGGVSDVAQHPSDRDVIYLAWQD